MTGSIIGDAAHKDGFMIITSKGRGSISGATAGAEINFVDVDFGAKLDLIEVAALVDAKIVVINKINVLKGSAYTYNSCH